MSRDVFYAHVVDAVRRMKPGQVMEADRGFLAFRVPPPWAPADWVLEQIVGSAYEYSWRQNPVTGGIVFRRRTAPLDDHSGLRTYVSADRRHHFEVRPDGLFAPVAVVKRDG